MTARTTGCSKDRSGVRSAEIRAVEIDDRSRLTSVVSRSLELVRERDPIWVEHSKWKPMTRCIEVADSDMLIGKIDSSINYFESHLADR